MSRATDTAFCMQTSVQDTPSYGDRNQVMLQLWNNSANFVSFCEVSPWRNTTMPVSKAFSIEKCERNEPTADFLWIWLMMTYSFVGRKLKLIFLAPAPLSHLLRWRGGWLLAPGAGGWCSGSGQQKPAKPQKLAFKWHKQFQEPKKEMHYFSNNSSFSCHLVAGEPEIFLIFWFLSFHISVSPS